MSWEPITQAATAIAASAGAGVALIGLGRQLVLVGRDVGRAWRRWRDRRGRPRRR